MDPPKTIPNGAMEPGVHSPKPGYQALFRGEETKNVMIP